MRLCSAFALLIGLLAVAAAADPFTYADDFTTHVPGGDGHPAWATDGIRWVMGAGVYTATGPHREQSLVAAAPCGTRVVVQTDCTVRSATDKGWKLAGVCLSADEQNYWHLALVEGPDDQGAKRFIELSEMLDGTWLAHGQAATRLKQTAGDGFAWERGRSYRLRLELTDQGIEGRVSEADGTVRARIAYAFDQTKARPDQRQPACGIPFLHHHRRGRAAAGTGETGAGL